MKIRYDIRGVDGAEVEAPMVEARFPFTYGEGDTLKVLVGVGGIAVSVHAEDNGEKDPIEVATFSWETLLDRGEARVSPTTSSHTPVVESKSTDRDPDLPKVSLDEYFKSWVLTAPNSEERERRLRCLQKEMDLRVKEEDQKYAPREVAPGLKIQKNVEGRGWFIFTSKMDRKTILPLEALDSPPVRAWFNETWENLDQAQRSTGRQG